MGDFGLIFRTIHRYLPGFDLFRSPAQYRFGLAFFAAVLAGIGMDNILAGEEGGNSLQKPLYRAYRAGIILIVAALVIVRFFIPARGNIVSVVLPNAFLFYALYAVFTAAVVFWERKRLPAYVFQAFVVLLAFTDFYLNGTDALSVGARMAHDELEKKPALTASIGGGEPQSGAQREKNPFSVSSREMGKGLYRVYVNDDPNSLLRVLPYIPYSYFKLGVVGFNRIILHEIFMVDGYNPMMLKRYVLFNGVLRDKSYSKFLMLSNVKYVIEPDGRLNVIPDAETLPRSYLVNSVEYIKNADAIIEKLADPSFDVRYKAIVEEPLELAQSVVSGVKGATRIVEYVPGRVTLVSESDRPALAVLSDSYYPGWQTSLDSDIATEALRVNYLFMGARVPPGRHTVTFEFRPRSIRIGIAVSLSALLLGVVVFLPVARRRRQNSFRRSI